MNPSISQRETEPENQGTLATGAQSHACSEVKQLLQYQESVHAKTDPVDSTFLFCLGMLWASKLVFQFTPHPSCASSLNIT